MIILDKVCEMLICPRCGHALIEHTEREIMLSNKGEQYAVGDVIRTITSCSNSDCNFYEVEE